MDFKALKKDLDAGVTQNLYVLYGEEKEVMRKYIKRIDSNAREAESFQSLVVRFQNTGLFNNGTHGTFYIYDDKSVQSMDIQDIVRLIGSATVIFIYDGMDQRTKFFKSVQNFAYEFPKLTDVQLGAITKKLLPMDDRCALTLVRFCNNDVARVESEVDKLIHLDQEITLNLIQDLVVREPEDVIFDMIKSLTRRQKMLTFDYYLELKERRESPIKIISLLYTQFKMILLIQSYSKLSNQEIADKTGINAGRIYHMKELIGAFSLEELRDILLAIQSLEVQVKTGKIDQHLGIEKLMLSILR